MAAERDVVAIFERWGIRTLGDLARLPRGDIRARTGLAGLGLHQAACGEDTVPLVPDVDAARFVERLQLEWPIEGLEPLSFVLARMCEALSRSLERADRGAVGLTTRLVLVSRETHARTLHLPAPMRDARVLRTLILLDLESHPPPAGIDAVEIELDAIAGRIVQGSLLARALPSSEDLATLIARLRALMGETHVGAPAIVDAHDDRAWTMRPFAPLSGARDGPRPMANGQRNDQTTMTDAMAPHPAPRAWDLRADSSTPVLALRRIRRPVPARVRLARGLPMHVQPSSRAVPVGDVVARAGPWRSSGHWWSDATCWDREEWEIEIAGGGCYRLARTRGQWEVEGEID
jgi:protein ImuB